MTKWGSGKLRSCQNLREVSFGSARVIITSLTSLCNADNVNVLEDRWQAVRLDGRRNLVPAKLNVVQHDRMQSSIFELAKVNSDQRSLDSVVAPYLGDRLDTGLALKCDRNIGESEQY